VSTAATGRALTPATSGGSSPINIDIHGGSNTPRSRNRKLDPCPRRAALSWTLVLPPYHLPRSTGDADIVEQIAMHWPVLHSPGTAENRGTDLPTPRTAIASQRSEAWDPL